MILPPPPILVIHEGQDPAIDLKFVVEAEVGVVVGAVAEAVADAGVPHAIDIDPTGTEMDITHTRHSLA